MEVPLYKTYQRRCDGVWEMMPEWGVPLVVGISRCRDVLKKSPKRPVVIVPLETNPTAIFRLIASL